MKDNTDSLSTTKISTFSKNSSANTKRGSSMGTSTNDKTSFGMLEKDLLKKPTRYDLVNYWTPSGTYPNLKKSPIGSLLLYADYEELEKKYLALLSDDNVRQVLFARGELLDIIHEMDPNLFYKAMEEHANDRRNQNS